MKALLLVGTIARKTKAQLIAELAAVRQRVIELETAATDRARVPEKAPGLVEAEALRVSELRYRRLFETARDGILLLDAATGADHRCEPVPGEHAGLLARRVRRQASVGSWPLQRRR